jgi:hypothetical protein
MTGVHNAIQILTTQTFKLTGGPHINPEHHYEDAAQLYHMSVARSLQSDFTRMMAGKGAVVLTINKAMLQRHHKIVPYQSADAAVEGWTDEMEDRVYSKTPIIRIPPPINQTIVHVRLFGEPFTLRGAGRSFSQEQLDQLKSLCQHNGIPFEHWGHGNDDEEAFLRGR